MKSTESIKNVIGSIFLILPLFVNGQFLEKVDGLYQYENRVFTERGLAEILETSEKGTNAYNKARSAKRSATIFGVAGAISIISGIGIYAAAPKPKIVTNRMEINNWVYTGSYTTKSVVYSEKSKRMRDIGGALIWAGVFLEGVTIYQVVHYKKDLSDAIDFFNYDNNTPSKANQLDTRLDLQTKSGGVGLMYTF